MDGRLHNNPLSGLGTIAGCIGMFRAVRSSGSLLPRLFE
jgi:hypothetical protein